MTNKKSRFANKLDINTDFKIIETTKVNVATYNFKVENSKTYKKGKSSKKESAAMTDSLNLARYPIEMLQYSRRHQILQDSKEERKRQGKREGKKRKRKKERKKETKNGVGNKG